MDKRDGMMFSLKLMYCEIRRLMKDLKNVEGLKTGYGKDLMWLEGFWSCVWK